MGIIRPKLKKKKVLYKRIGLAIIPPAAFTVVPGYTLPRSNGMPKTKGVKRFAAGSTAIVASIALPSVVNELDDKEESWSFNSVPDEGGEVTKHKKKKSTKIIAPSAAVELETSKEKSRRRESSRRKPEYSDQGKSPRRKVRESRQRPTQEEEVVVKEKVQKSSRRRQETPVMEEWSENAATALMKTSNAMEGDVEEELSESLLKLMQKIIDKNSIVSDSSIISGIDPDDESMDKRRRKKRQKLRKLKSLVETKSLSSLEGVVDDEEEATSSEKKRVRRRRSLKKLKERVTRSSVTSLEQEFGSQLTFGSKKKVSDNSNTSDNRNTRDNRNTSDNRNTRDNSRYNIVEESLQRALTELYYFQQEFGKQSHIKKQADLITCEMPEWLTDPETLSPLFDSYDRKLKRKDEEIKILQENLSLIGSGDFSGKKANVENLEESLNNLRQENSRLLSKCHEFSLQVSALQDNVEREQKKNEETDRMCKRTRQELEVALEDLSISEKEKEKMKADGRERRSIISKLEEEIETSLPKTIHNVEMKGVKMELEEVKERHDHEMNNYRAMLKTAQMEQANAQLETASISSRLTAAEGEVESLCLERSEKISEMEILRQRNTTLMDDYETGQSHLANTIRVAEQALLERMSFAQLVEREQMTSSHALDQSKKEKYEMGRMEQTLRQVKVRLSTQTDELNEKLAEHQQSHQSEMINLKREITHLKKQLNDKDAVIVNIREKQRRTEVEMDAICENAANETRFIMKSLHSS